MCVYLAGPAVMDGAQALQGLLAAQSIVTASAMKVDSWSDWHFPEWHVQILR